MEYMEWTDELSVGVEEIDRQHQELFRRVNTFLSAVDREEGHTELERTVEFLQEYVVRHFESEEAYMVENNYPGWIAHKEQHLEFATRFAELRQRVDSDRPTLELLEQGKALLVDWYKRHIRQMDAALGEFWRKKLES